MNRSSEFTTVTLSRDGRLCELRKETLYKRRIPSGGRKWCPKALRPTPRNERRQGDDSLRKTQFYCWWASTRWVDWRRRTSVATTGLTTPGRISGAAARPPCATCRDGKRQQPCWLSQWWVTWRSATIGQSFVYQTKIFDGGQRYTPGASGTCHVANLFGQSDTSLSRWRTTLTC